MQRGNSASVFWVVFAGLDAQQIPLFVICIMFISSVFDIKKSYSKTVPTAALRAIFWVRLLKFNDHLFKKMRHPSSHVP